MEIKHDPDYVPSTVEEAVDILWRGVDTELREALSERPIARESKATGKIIVANITRPDGSQHQVDMTPLVLQDIGRQVRNAWSLWEDTPLRRDAIDTYGIAHADDIWGLMRAWLTARIDGDDNWKPQDYVDLVTQHWAASGKTPLQAAGIYE